MTDEGGAPGYEPGQEDLGVVVYARPDGLISLNLHFLNEDRTAGLRIAGALLHTQTALNVARNLTYATWQIEDAAKWQEEQGE